MAYSPQLTSAFFEYGGHYYNVANIAEIYSDGEKGQHTVLQFHGGRELIIKDKVVKDVVEVLRQSSFFFEMK